jgi:hypothetical protein
MRARVMRPQCCCCRRGLSCSLCTCLSSLAAVIATSGIQGLPYCSAAACQLLAVSSLCCSGDLCRLTEPVLVLTLPTKHMDRLNRLVAPAGSSSADNRHVLHCSVRYFIDERASIPARVVSGDAGCILWAITLRSDGGSIIACAALTVMGGPRQLEQCRTLTRAVFCAARWRCCGVKM